MPDKDRAITNAEDQLAYLIQQLAEADRTNVVVVCEDILKIAKTLEFLKGYKDA